MFLVTIVLLLVMVLLLVVVVVVVLLGFIAPDLCGATCCRLGQLPHAVCTRVGNESPLATASGRLVVVFSVFSIGSLMVLLLLHPCV